MSFVSSALRTLQKENGQFGVLLNPESDEPSDDSVKAYPLGKDISRIFFPKA